MSEPPGVLYKEWANGRGISAFWLDSNGALRTARQRNIPGLDARAAIEKLIDPEKGGRPATNGEAMDYCGISEAEVRRALEGTARR